MTGFLLRRTLGVAFTVWIVFTVSFFLMRAVPGGPFMSERKVSAEIERNQKARYNLDLPVHQQYTLELTNYLQGDLGRSMKMADFTVSQVIEQGFPISAAMGLFALYFAIAFGMTAGVLSAVYRQTGVDAGLMAAATLGIAVPNFVFASVSILLFVFLIPIFPPAGWGTLRQLILPSICIGLPYAAYIARLTRTGMLDVLQRDYIRTARAKGLAPNVVIVRHALKGALVPVVSFLGPAIAGILTGSLVVERIFAIPGMGSHFVEAAIMRDYPMAMGMIVVYTLMLSVMNVLVDLSYSYLDPRVKVE